MGCVDCPAYVHPGLYCCPHFPVAFFQNTSVGKACASSVTFFLHKILVDKQSKYRHSSYLFAVSLADASGWQSSAIASSHVAYIRGWSKLRLRDTEQRYFSSFESYLDLSVKLLSKWPLVSGYLVTVACHPWRRIRPLSDFSGDLDLPFPSTNCWLLVVEIHVNSLGLTILIYYSRRSTSKSQASSFNFCNQQIRLIIGALLAVAGPYYVRQAASQAKPRVSLHRTSDYW